MCKFSISYTESIELRWDLEIALGDRTFTFSFWSSPITFFPQNVVPFRFSCFFRGPSHVGYLTTTTEITTPKLRQICPLLLYPSRAKFGQSLIDRSLKMMHLLQIETKRQWITSGLLLIPDRYQPKMACPRRLVVISPIVIQVTFWLTIWEPINRNHRTTFCSYITHAWLLCGWFSPEPFNIIPRSRNRP